MDDSFLPVIRCNIKIETEGDELFKIEFGPTEVRATYWDQN